MNGFPNESGVFSTRRGVKTKYDKEYTDLWWAQRHLSHCVFSNGLNFMVDPGLSLGRRKDG
jgi:hypothetical protein